MILMVYTLPQMVLSYRFYRSRTVKAQTENPCYILSGMKPYRKINSALELHGIVCPVVESFKETLCNKLSLTCGSVFCPCKPFKEPRNRFQPGGIDISESIPGLVKRLQIRALCCDTQRRIGLNRGAGSGLGTLSLLR
jgi:hypothetical protein